MMLSRCVVIVDGGYARGAAAMVLGAGATGGALVQNADQLADTLRDIAEETSGQDLLRMYWYERAEYDADIALLQAAPYVCVRRDYAHSLGSQIAADLSALLPHVQTGDVLFCTDNDDLRDIMHRTQQQGRHVHLLQVAGLRRAKPSAALMGVTDTWRWWPAETLAPAFRPIAALSELRGYGAPQYAGADMAGDGSAIETSEVGAQPYAATESLYGAVDTMAQHASLGSTPNAAVPTRLSANRQEQSEYLAARLREITASHAVQPRVTPANAGDATSPSRAAPGQQPFTQDYATGRTVTRFEPPRSSARTGSDGVGRADGGRSAQQEIPSDLSARLRDIAEDIADEIDLPDVATLRTWDYGIPAHIDRQLLGASHSTIGMLLDGAQKSLLRRFFREACLSRLTD